MHINHRSPPCEAGSDTLGVDHRVYDALTDLTAFVLTLEWERLRLHTLAVELADGESSAAERRALRRECDDISEELAALRCTITALQEQVAPPAAAGR
jgi:hypothetical protein